MNQKSHEYQRAHKQGTKILKNIGWQPNPDAMFKAPSLAKGSPARKARDASGTSPDDVLLAARLVVETSGTSTTWQLVPVMGVPMMASVDAVVL